MTTASFAEPTRGSHAAALLLCRIDVEIWRTTYESDAYEVSNLGRLRRAKTKRVLKGHVNQATGYRQYKMLEETRISHRVVARAFIPNPEEKPTVDHYKSSEKSNNKLTNLRWATLEEQQANRKRSATNGQWRRPVRMLDKETREFIRRFESGRAAARYLNTEHGFKNIFDALRGRKKTAHGYAWEYEPPETIEGEEWRPIPRELFDLREPHEVSSCGRIMNTTTGRVGSGSTQDNGVVVFSLKLTDGCARVIPVARLVASVFLEENTETKPLVHHVDGDSANNCVSNLTWATRAEVAQASSARAWTKEEDVALRDFAESADRDNRGWIKWKGIITLPTILKNRTVHAMQLRLHRFNRSET